MKHARESAGGTGPPELAYAGDTWWSAQTVRFNAAAEVVRRFDRHRDMRRSRPDSVAGHESGRAANAAKRRLNHVIGVVVVGTGIAVDMPGGLIAAMGVHMPGEIVVQVNRAVQDEGRLRHRPNGGSRMRDRDKRALLDECGHRQQHEAAEQLS
jgi:hypothetical protein